MKFGLFYELSVPRPWTRESDRTVYMNALEQVQLADELGFDQVWAVEHHFLEEYSHCPAPELFLTACAMTTKKIRVGHGIVICVPEFNHPIKIAERTAVLDILSGGRLEVGTGRSATWTELGGFRADPDTTKKSWDEFVRCLPKMWTQDSRTRRCGSPAPPRAPSSTPPIAASAAWGSPSASSPSRRSASPSTGGASASASRSASSSTIRSAP
jgi:alkanesulfonate monooxygenase SsuD/methylene tetrahydromethanopterin reductase-like flavin-dependent oxidoreductase (luciferase family)